MAATMNQKQLREHIAGVVKDCMKEERPALVKENEEGFKAAVKEIELRLTEIYRSSDSPDERKFSLENRSHPYVRRYGHRLRSDTIWLPGGTKDTRRLKANGAGTRFARLIRSGVQARRAGITLKEVLEARGDKWMIEDLEEQEERALKSGLIHKAQGSDIFETGGALVPEDYAAEFVELLRAMVVMRAAGVIQIPLPNGNVTFRRRLTSSALQYAAEGGVVASSQSTYGQIKLNARELRGSVPIANAFLEMADADIDILTRDDLLAEVAQRSDLAFIRGDGSGEEPRGIRYLADASQFVTSAGTGTDNKVTDLAGALIRLATANVPMQRIAWLMNPRTRINLMSTRDPGGGFLFRSEMDAGSLFGAPIFETTQIPSILGGGSETEIYLFSPPNVWIGDQTFARIETFPGGAYNDGSQVVSAISTDETVISVKAKHDIDITHGVVVAGVTGVQY